MWSKTKPAFLFLIRLKIDHNKGRFVHKKWIIPIPLFVAKDLVGSFENLTIWGEKLIHPKKSISPIFRIMGEILDEVMAIGRFKFIEIDLDDVTVEVALY